MTGIEGLRLEHAAATLGIGVAAPRLSWALSGERSQRAYEVEVSFIGTDESTTVVVDSTDTLYQPWPARPLRSREAAHVRVRSHLVGDEAPTAWSAPVRVEAGLLDAVDWVVDWVSPSLRAPHDSARAATLLRAEFDVEGRVRRARVYATAHGVYDLEVNGTAASDEVLAPGWSSYLHRLRYRTLDITETLAEGRNAIGAWLADGWYRGRLGFNGGLWDNYGTDVSLLLQLEIEDDRGVRVVPLHWTHAPAPIVATGLYEGERHDARLEPDGWSAPGFAADDWEAANTLPRRQFSAELEAPTGPPVRVIESIRPVTAERRDDGRLLLDFGQNIAGKLRFTVAGTPGETVTLRHAEVLEAGELALRPLRSATSEDAYTFATAEPVTWTPRFTLHGFRYAEIIGWPADAGTDGIEALVVHSDMRRTGWFEADHPLLDRFHENVVWSMRDNFVDLPTDCPQRDERLGWSGDIQVFAPTASYLFDATGVLENWLRDLAAEQQATGSVLNFHPWIDCGFPVDPAAAWGDAAVIVPWTLYRRTGDLELLRTHFDSMRAWVEQVFALTHETGHWNEGFQLGDWLDPAAPPERPGDSRTDASLVATAYHARTARLVLAAAELLGDTAAVARYAHIADLAATAFRTNYVAPSGRVVSDTVTALSVAIAFELLEGDQYREAGERLAVLVAEGDHLIATGFVGTPIVCDALTSTGHLDDAYHLLLRTEAPSWLYAVTMGATTVWERWDSMLPDGRINPGEMTSFNHYALGAVADFLHRVVGGLEELEPGYRRVRIAPRPGGGLGRASVRHDSPFGTISCEWVREGGRMTVELRIPVGVTAEVVLPDGTDQVETVGAGAHRFEFAHRTPDEDAARPRRWNIHNPEERAQMMLEGAR
ncbi:family 78 glycoside hydrolase catalytic domain [Agromyces sp. Root1464]|uniref:family 78 glycoside hydrolase catalytic domain n=1 Tax=Agromyces sp. Root1464 TaxID=1736467 RepID=UPI0009EABA84|nr:family 78 glycoside hydrolase catalytic domain [Agromyces sp. Root1464]